MVLGITVSRRTILSLGAATLFGLLAGLGVSPHARAEMKPKFHSSSSVKHPSFVGLKRFAAAVKAGSGGAINIQLFPNMQLGGELEAAQGIKLGSIQAGMITSSVFGGWVSEVQLIDLPFLFRSNDHALTSSAVLTKRLAPKFRAQGFELLGFTLSGVRHPIGTFPIRTPDDVKGKKMRVIQSPLHIAIWKSLGANPTPIPAPEIYNALQTGVVDFFDFTKTYYLQFKFHEVAKYFTDLGHIYAFNAWVANGQWWKGLTPKQQALVRTAVARESRLIHRAIIAGEDKALAKTVLTGTKIFTVKDKEPWRKRMAPIWGKFFARVPDAKPIVDAVLAVK